MSIASRIQPSRLSAYVLAEAWVALATDWADFLADVEALSAVVPDFFAVLTVSSTSGWISRGLSPTALRLSLYSWRQPPGVSYLSAMP